MLMHEALIQVFDSVFILIAPKDIKCVQFLTNDLNGSLDGVAIRVCGYSVFNNMGIKVEEKG